MGNACMSVVNSEKKLLPDTKQKNSLCSFEEIMDQQLKRYRKQYTGLQKPELIGLKQIGFNSNNLYRLIESGRIRLLKCEADSDKQITFYFENPSDEIWVQLEAGTLLAPERLFPDLQAVIIKGEENFEVPMGISEKVFKTLCYDCEKDVPCKKNYRLGTIKSGKYKSGMEQKDAWAITIQPDKIESIPTNADLQKIQINTAIFTKKEIKNMIEHWADDDD